MLSGVTAALASFRLHATSAAVISPKPLWNMTPSWIVTVVADRSGAMTNDFASIGPWILPSAVGMNSASPMPMKLNASLAPWRLRPMAEGRLSPAIFMVPTAAWGSGSETDSSLAIMASSDFSMAIASSAAALAIADPTAASMSAWDIPGISIRALEMASATSASVRPGVCSLRAIAIASTIWPSLDPDICDMALVIASAI